VTSVDQRDPTTAANALRWTAPLVLVSLAATGWWWSARMASDMTSSGSTAMGDMTGMAGMGEHTLGVGAFLVAWLAMMTAMMFPAIAPVVKLYGRAAAAGRVAPLPFFVAGYIAVWTSIGLPAYFAWQALMDPIAEVRPWAGRLAGGVLLAAGVWQLTPLKSACLRHCRSPMSFFLRFGSSVARPGGALRMGVTHGLFCLGCCWALMAVLVAMGTMNLAWMAALALLIIVEKNAPAGERVASLAALALAVGGVLLLVRPETLTTLT
jgi:predicted metal-binding membrane protein